VLLVGIELIVHGFFGISAFYIDYILTIITIGALLMAIIVTFFRRDSLYYSIMATLILLAQIIYQSSNTFFSEPHNYTNWFHFNQLHIYAHIGLVFILLILAFSYYFNKVEDSEEWAQKSRRMIAHSAINDLKIINWKIEEDESLTVEDLKRNANIKIEAMINSYYLLFTSSGVKGIVEPELFFRKLLTNLLEKQGYHQSETYVEVPDLHIETSLPLLQDYGFILVEMLVNAIKYSPQEEDSFKIEVSTSPTTLTMRVENTIDDSGESIPSLEYGMRIVQDLVSDKKGDIHRSQQGNRYAVQVVVPINRFRG
jgi:two-component sensor histidine kinase